MQTSTATSAIATELEQALALHKLGQLDQAQAAYQNVLDQDPKQITALHLMGMLRRQQRQFQAALDLFDQALTIDPNYSPALSSRGSVLRDLGRPQEALVSYEKALALNPNSPELHTNRGTALRDLKRTQEAVACYDRALALKPQYMQAHYNRGNALRDLERHDEAIASYSSALALQPNNMAALRNRGNVFLDLKKPELALSDYAQVLKIKPDCAETLNNQGAALQDLKRPHEALACYAKSLAINPDYPEALNNRANTLRYLNRLEEALNDYTRATQLEPDYAQALSNRGNVLKDLQRTDEALLNYAQALAIDPSHHESNWNESLCRLLMGDFEAGWAKYEARWFTAMQKKTRPTFEQPLWLGQESLQGKTILLHAEQGFGDTIQLARYVPMVRDLGATVLLQVQPALNALLADLDGVRQFIKTRDELKNFDYYCPLLTLPHALKTTLNTIPWNGSYIHAAPERVARWREQLGPPTGPRAGLVWSGNPKHENDHNRSIALEKLTRLRAPGVQFFSLQKEVRDSDQAALQSRADITQVNHELGDFTDTAALIELLDVVITVDTSIAHLAGAMGKPVWVLLPYAPDWRWMLGRNDSPWYPSIRLFRQPVVMDWDSVVDEVVAALEVFLGRISAA